MKSKTSCFNRTIFKKNITHYWPIWALYLAYLLLIMPYSLWQMISMESYYYESYTKQERGYIFIEIVLRNGLAPMVIFIVSVLIAMFLFSYLYTARNTNMMHALPVTRLELFVTNYLSGIVFLMVPQLVTFFVTVLVCVAGQITCIQFLFYWLLYVAGMSVFAFSLAVFVAMFTGQKGALLAYYFVVNFLYVGCVFLLSGFQQIVSWGQVDYLTPGKTAVLSPLYYLMRRVGASCMYDRATGMPNGIEMYGGISILIYAAVGLFLAAAAYQLYKRRQLETAGDMVSIGIVKPIFRWGVAVCGGFTLSMIVIGSTIYDTSISRIYFYFIIGIIISGSICFFIAQMLLEKNFRVFKKKRLIECGVFCILCVVTLLLFKADAFGIERYQPKAEEIERAFVYMDYIIMLDEEDIPEILEIQKEVIGGKEDYQANMREEHYYYTTFRYELKDGSKYTRRYPIPLKEGDGNTPYVRLLALEKDKGNLKKTILGNGYEDGSLYHAGSVDVYSEDGKGDTVQLDTDAVKGLMQAIGKDIEEGNYDDYYIPCISYAADIADSEKYENTIILDRYMKNDNWDDEDYYYGSMNGGFESASSDTDVYIRFGEKCVHTIAFLEESGIIDETWKLMTEEEFYNSRDNMD